MPNVSEVQSILNEKYGTFEQRVDETIAIYKSLYNLPVLEREFKVSHEFYARCSKIARMVVVALYDTLKNVLLVESQSKFDLYTTLGDRLLGAAFSPMRQDRIEEVVRWTVRAQVGTDIVELRPLAVVINHFAANGHQATHRGLAFMAASASPLAEFVNRTPGTKIVQSLPEECAFQNKQILELTFAALSNKYLSPPLAEVHEPSRKRVGKWIHKNIVHRLLLRKFATDKIRSVIFDQVQQGDTVLDVSAGTDRLMLELYERRGPRLCVLNDIAWQAMEELRHIAKRTACNIIFTNHNVADMPFKERFDVVLFKNTLHHLRSGQECLAVLERLAELGNRIIICEIEEPRRTFRGRMFNLYYERVVGDGDRNNIFYDYSAFQRLIEAYFDDASAQFKRLWTPRGDYMFAIVDRAKQAGAVG